MAHFSPSAFIFCRWGCESVSAVRPGRRCHRGRWSRARGGGWSIMGPMVCRGARRGPSPWSVTGPPSSVHFLGATVMFRWLPVVAPLTVTVVPVLGTSTPVQPAGSGPRATRCRRRRRSWTTRTWCRRRRSRRAATGSSPPDRLVDGDGVRGLGPEGRVVGQQPLAHELAVGVVVEARVSVHGRIRPPPGWSPTLLSAYCSFQYQTEQAVLVG